MDKMPSLLVGEGQIFLCSEEKSGEGQAVIFIQNFAKSFPSL